jgi:hypothetical protein
VYWGQQKTTFPVDEKVADFLRWLYSHHHAKGLAAEDGLHALSLIFQNLSAGIGTRDSPVASLHLVCRVAEASSGRSLRLSG